MQEFLVLIMFFLALAVASRAVSPDRVMKMLHARGRGI